MNIDAHRIAYKPLELGSRFQIVSSADEPKVEGRIQLVMARGAFGSGEHETTASCLALMASLPELKGARVLDLGCGTGILAIAALKLGAESALCVDVDPAAVETCQYNCQENGVGDRVALVCGTLADVDEPHLEEKADIQAQPGVASYGFHVVLANIYADILTAVAEDLVSKTRPRGLLLLSGIPLELNYDVQRVYERLGCVMRKYDLLEEFCTMLFRAPDGTSRS